MSKPILINDKALDTTWKAIKRLLSGKADATSLSNYVKKTDDVTLNKKLYIGSHTYDGSADVVVDVYDGSTT